VEHWESKSIGRVIHVEGIIKKGEHWKRSIRRSIGRGGRIGRAEH